MTRRPYVYWLAPPRIGGLDVLVPMLCELRASGAISGCCVVIEDRKAFDALPDNALLHSLLYENADRVWPLFADGSATAGMFGRIARLTGFARLFAGILSRRDVMFIHACKHRRRLVGAIAGLVRMRGGKTLFHPASMALPANGTRVDLTRADAEIVTIFAPEGYETALGRVAVSLGYPRAMPGWQARVGAWIDARNGRAERTTRRGNRTADAPRIATFMSSTVDNVFEAADLEKWSDALGRALRKVYPKARVAIKPHPLSSPEEVARTLLSFSGQEAVIVHEHPTAVCAMSDVVVTPHSTTVIDALASGKPTVGFQELTEKWLARHPDGSRYLKFCALWARTETELEQALLTVREGRYVAPELPEFCAANAASRLGSLVAPDIAG